MSLWLSSAFAQDDHLTQARAILDYYLADNTPDLAFRQSLDPQQAEDALALVDKHIALHPLDEQARAWSALAFTARGEHDSALAEIEAALDAGLTGSAWLNLAGDIHYARGDLSSALDWYSRAALLKKNSWHQWDVARTLSEIGDSGAEAAWDKLVADYPQSVSAWLERGWHKYELRDYAKAKADYEKAIRIKDSAEAHNRLAILLVATGDAAGAEAEYRTAIALEASPQLYANLIELMRARNAPDSELEPVYKELLAAFPDDHYAQRVNGDRLRAAGNPQAALEAYRRAGEDAYTLNAIGNCQFDLKQYDAAAQTYAHSLQLAYDPVVLGNLATTLRAGGKHDEERALWEKHVALHGDDGSMRLGYADALFAAGQFEPALEQYRRARQAGADSAELRNQSGLALLQLGRPAEAADEFTAAAAQDAQPVYFGNAGYALGLAGQWAEAEAVYRAGLEKFPADADLTSGLGEALAAQGRSGEAAGEVAKAANAGSAALSGGALDNNVTEVAASQQSNETRIQDSEQEDQPVIQSVPSQDVSPQTVAKADEAPPQSAALPVKPKVVPGEDSAAQARLFAEAAKHARAAGNVEQALQAYRDSFAAQPDLDVAADWSLLLAEQNRGGELVQLAATVREQLGVDAGEKLVDRIGRFYLEGRDFAGGSALMQRLIADAPRSAMPYNQLALMQASQQDTTSALATVKRGLNDAGDNYIGRYLEASFTAAVSGPTAALPLAKEVTRLADAERNGYMLYLKLLEQHGNYSEEAEVARAAYAKNPGNGALFGYLARALYFSGDPQGAIDVLEDPANAKVEYPARYEILGQSYLDLGNYAKAAGYLTQALALRPESAELLAALGQAQHFLGESDKARTTLGKALNIDPELPAARLWQGWVQAGAGDAEAALRNFGEVEASPLADKEELAWAALGRAALSAQTGDRTNAAVLADKAAAFGVQSEAFYAELDQVRAKL